ncbi:hypothetical protein KEM55_006139 [Ascosphaera atra]|nr:hypothetical protein KEM55_006139 [Ascosphaera atra]
MPAPPQQQQQLAVASLSLTHVYYVRDTHRIARVLLANLPQNPHDPFSYVCALLALVPQALCIVYATLLWSTRELEIALMFAGQMGCQGVNTLLKRVIREERPRELHGHGYGMPSSHAQYVGFFSTYLALFLLFRHAPTAGSSSSSSADRRSTGIPYPLRLFISVLAVASAAIVAGSRVYLRYHTKRQVLAGLTLGVVVATCWFVVTACARRLGLLDWGLNTRIARLARVRDLVREEDPAEAGWVRWLEKQRQRERERERREMLKKAN